MTSPAKFLFLDLETTGLDETTDSILEIGCVLTTEKLDELDQWSTTVYPGAAAIANMSDTARDMHEKNGLLAVLDKGSWGLGSAEKRLLNLLTQYHGVQPKTLVMAGFGIQFDQRFIRRHMPALYEFLHYRILDVRSVQYAVEALTDVPMIPRDSKPHRALPDAMAALEELRRIGKRHLVADKACAEPFPG